MLSHGNSVQATVGTRSRLNGKPTDAVRDWLVIYLYPISLEMVIFLFLGQDSEIPEMWPICLCFFTQMFCSNLMKAQMEGPIPLVEAWENNAFNTLCVFHNENKAYSRKDETKQIPNTMTYITKPSFPEEPTNLWVHVKKKKTQPRQVESINEIAKVVRDLNQAREIWAWNNWTILNL